tara:strand:+ start:921 stop:1142 length:222 start_codon:yes stop_codon:yes gene_type:complete
MRGKKMSNEKIKDSEYYLKDISKSLNNLNEIMSAFLFIVIKDSTLNKLTENQIKEISPSIMALAKLINKSIND